MYNLAESYITPPQAYHKIGELWFLTYLNNVRNGSSNKGDGTVTTQQGPYQIIEALDWLTPPNVMARLH